MMVFKKFPSNAYNYVEYYILIIKVFPTRVQQNQKKKNCVRINLLHNSNLHFKVSILFAGTTD